MRLAYSETIQPSPRMPMAETRTASGAAPPAPWLAALSPTSSGTRNAIEKTGPMNPIDCATASGSLSLRWVVSRSYDVSDTGILLGLLGLGGLPSTLSGLTAARPDDGRPERLLLNGCGLLESYGSKRSGARPIFHGVSGPDNLPSRARLPCNVTRSVGS